MRYFLDTNVVILYLRNRENKKWFDEKFHFFDAKNIVAISVVTLGELESISIRNKWGQKRIQGLNFFCNKCLTIDINAEDIIKRYGEIDAFSQNKKTDKPLGMTARNMGKNDLWIAATASITESKLITTDKDFRHLDKKYLDLGFVELKI